MQFTTKEGPPSHTIKGNLWALSCSFYHLNRF